MSINRGLGFASERNQFKNESNLSVFKSLGPILLRTSTVPASSWSEDRSEPLAKVRLQCFKIDR